ncbi:MAG TPA: hypothetical protein VKA68_17350, partial [bacterium]|nr:hypothetical protein [bacterium]
MRSSPVIFSKRNFLIWFILTFIITATCKAVTPTHPAPHQRVEEQVSIAAKAFPLSQVRLLDGPFKEARQRDMEYLLRLDPDRLLAGFRREAGLEPLVCRAGSRGSLLMRPGRVDST